MFRPPQAAFLFYIWVMTLKEKYKSVIEFFESEMPVAETELNYENPFQLLIAVILSAQCTDKRINQVTPALFERFSDPESLAAAPVDEIFQYIRSVSYPNSKSKYLSGMAKKIMDEFGGKVPDNVNDLQKLPGVGRKTANVIVSVVHQAPAMAVDTHVFRVSNRIGLTNNSKNPLQTEKTLTKYIPQEKVHIAHHWLILHGRYVCTARNPKCNACKISHLCKHFNSNAKSALPQKSIE
jgi:endonuclease-3